MLKRGREKNQQSSIPCLVSCKRNLNNSSIQHPGSCRREEASKGLADRSEMGSASLWFSQSVGPSGSWKPSETIGYWKPPAERRNASRSPGALSAALCGCFSRLAWPVSPDPAPWAEGLSQVHPSNYCGWTKCILRHLGTLVEAIVRWYLQGKSSFQVFFRGASFHPSTVSPRTRVTLGWLAGKPYGRPVLTWACLLP